MIRGSVLLRLGLKRCIPDGRLMSVASDASKTLLVSSRLYHATTTAAGNRKTALVIGSSGCLGSTVSRYLSRQMGMKVIGADLRELPDNSDWEPDAFVALPHLSQNPNLAELTTRLTRGVGYVLEGSNDELDAIICASGGWEGDPKPPNEIASDEEVEAGAAVYGDAIEKMFRMNLEPVVAAGYVAQQYMGSEGLFVVMGATAALSPTPGMIGYGLSKAAAHHYVQTLGASTGLAVSPKLKRKESRRLRQHGEYLDTLTVVGILPTTIDTPTNRDVMPDADFSKWTKPIDIAKEIGKWVERPPLRPHSGSLIKVFPTGGEEEGATFHLVR